MVNKIVCMFGYIVSVFLGIILALKIGIDKGGINNYKMSESDYHYMHAECMVLEKIFYDSIFQNHFEICKNYDEGVVLVFLYDYLRDQLDMCDGYMFKYWCDTSYIIVQVFASSFYGLSIRDILRLNLMVNKEQYNNVFFVTGNLRENKLSVFHPMSNLSLNYKIIDSVIVIVSVGVF